jgi:hypothetical protein
VFDETQEFLRDLTNAIGVKKDCIEKVRLCSDKEESMAWVVVLLPK